MTRRHRRMLACAIIGYLIGHVFGSLETERRMRAMFALERRAYWRRETMTRHAFRCDTETGRLAHCLDCHLPYTARVHHLEPV